MMKNLTLQHTEIGDLILIMTFVFNLSACSKGRYGPNCEFFCDCDNDSSCDPLSGTCVCQSGFIGPKCQYLAGM